VIPRRQFITLLSGAVAGWPLAARGQQPAKVPRVGILSPAASETAGTLSAFREKIRDLGYVEGETIALDFRLSKGIMELSALGCSVASRPWAHRVLAYWLGSPARSGATLACVCIVSL
jgi:putative tryptophan/tyrosine transport system substrate-binding protein